MNVCSVCGNEIRGHGFRYYGGRCACSDSCAHKLFFQEIIENKKDYAIIKGTVYKDGGNVESPRHPEWLGFEGRVHHIRYFNGKDVITNNLFYIAKVDDEYKDVLKDNAEFQWEV